MRGYPVGRLLLFLAVLFLPTIAIVAQGVMIASRDREIAEGRARERVGDLRRRLAAEVGQEMFALLERIKGQEVANATVSASCRGCPAVLIPQPGTYSDPAVVLVGRVDGRALMWPWDRNYAFADAHRERMQDPPFAQMAADARRAEVEPDRARARDLYRALLSAARTNGQLAHARLGLGRVLRDSGDRQEAVAVYRRVLDDSADSVDEHRVSFASLAATELAQMRAAPGEVLDRVQQDLESRAALLPIQTDRWRLVLEALTASDDEGVRERAGRLLDVLLTRASDLQAAQSVAEVRQLQRDFPTLSVNATSWIPYSGANGEIWLVGRAAGRSVAQPATLRSGPDDSGAPAAAVAPPGWARDARIVFSPDGRFLLFDAVLPLVVVVRADGIRQSVESDRASAGRALAFTVSLDGDGEPLATNAFPGLRVAFPDLEADVAADAGLPRSFYAWSMLFVVPLTFAGGYLVWRDSRREVRTASLRSQFVSSVSHELKTPLTSIRMFAEALQMKYSADPQVHQEYLDTIVNESERLTRLLDNVLDFSRIDRGEKRYHAEPTRLADVVRAAARAMQYPLEQQGFVLGVRADEQLPPVRIDRDALQQAILNLLTNAMKYSGTRRDIELELVAEGGSAVIRVSDHGIGISEQEQARIFDAFYRAPIPENLAIPGTGLGLALVAHVASAHGGSVHVQSRPGEGSTFSVRLPLPAEAA